MANYVLFQWGPIQFQVFPLNVGQLSHNTASDWAKKEVAGAAIYREWVGEQDELITLKGKVFPHYFAKASRARGIRHPVLDDRAGINPESGMLGEHTGGFPSAGGLFHLDVLDNMRRLGQAHILMRGDGWHFGWFVIEELSRAHSLIAQDGVGQMVEFEAKFQRVPIPNDGSAGITQLWTGGSVTDQGGGGTEQRPVEQQAPIAIAPPPEIQGA